MKQWYTLYTKPNAEYKVQAALERQDIQTYLPEIKLPKARRGYSCKPFFPCYLFSQVDFDVVGLSQIKWTPGLRRIVTFGDRPAPLSDKVVNLIRSKLGDIEAQGGWPAHDFKPGDTVQITEGPLKDMLAIFKGPTTPSQRVQVLLNFLGHASRVQVDVTDLKKADPDAEAPTPKRPRRTRGGGRRIKNR